MKFNSEDHAKLTQLIDQRCGEQPPLKAPSMLHARVSAALERRASLPWWRKSFVYWPLAARVVFVLAALAMALSITMALNTRLAALALDTPLSGSWSWLQNVSALLSFLNSLANYVGVTVLLHIPTGWLYGGMLGVLTMYALLLGVGAAAYRTLYATR